MKKFLIATAVAGLMSSSAMAANVGVSMAMFDDNFLTVLRNGMQDYAPTKGVTLQIEDAQNDVGKQLNQIQNFLASGVDAIIVNAVDTDATAAMSKAAEAAGVPLVYVNRTPANAAKLPAGQAFVGSDEAEAGRLETTEVCRLLKAAGKTDAKAVILMGELANQASRVRTEASKAVLATPDCSFIKVVEEQTANWQRTTAVDLVTNWLSGGVNFDAIISNNDEMAIGAVQALKSAGVRMQDVVVAGVDATADGLAAVAAGDMDVTVFQNAVGQGRSAVDAALKLAAKGTVEPVILVPFELVTPAQVKDYQARSN